MMELMQAPWFLISIWLAGCWIICGAVWFFGDPDDDAAIVMLLCPLWPGCLAIFVVGVVIIGPPVMLVNAFRKMRGARP